MSPGCSGVREPSDRRMSTAPTKRAQTSATASASASRSCGAELSGGSSTVSFVAQGIRPSRGSKVGESATYPGCPAWASGAAKQLLTCSRISGAERKLAVIWMRLSGERAVNASRIAEYAATWAPRNR